MNYYWRVYDYYLDFGPQSVQPSGIASAEAFGTTVVVGSSIAPSGIGSAEAFGTAALLEAVLALPVQDGEQFGTPLVVLIVSIAGASLRTPCGSAIMTDPCPISVPTP